jgi:hypothetical protein
VTSMLSRAFESVSWWVRSTIMLCGAMGAGLLRVPELEGDDTEEFSPEEIAEIRRNLEHIRRDIDLLREEHLFEDLGALLRSIFGSPEATQKSLAAWVNLIDELAQEIETHYGSNPGLGRYKNLQLKAGVLYFLERSEFQLPGIPSYLQPFFFDLGLDPWIAGVVRLLNRHQLWSEKAQPKSRLNRYTTIAFRAPASTLYGIRRFLASISWRIVFFFNPVSPGVKGAIDRLIQQDPDPLRKPVLLLQWILAHAEELVPLVDLVAAATVEAQRFLESDGAKKKAYAREVILVFLEDTVGLPDKSSLSFELLTALIDAAIDGVVFLFKKHNHPAFRRTYNEPAPVA